MFVSAASSFSNSLSIPQVSISLPLTSSMDYDSTEIDFKEGQDIIVDDIPETYRLTHFGQDVSDLSNHSNVPITYIDFEDIFEERRRSKMIPDSINNNQIPSNSVVSQQSIDQEYAETARNNHTQSGGTVNKSDLHPQQDTFGSIMLKQGVQGGSAHQIKDQEVAGSNLISEENTTESEFKLANYNVDTDARTWTPMKMNGDGEIERTDVSKPLDQSDWIPKLGPDFKIRET